MKTKIDFNRLQNEIEIVSLAKQIGMQVRGTQARCYNSGFHKHGDRSYSLTFGSKNHSNLYFCFTCGEKGNVVSLYQKVNGLATWMDAARELWHDYFGGITKGMTKKQAMVYRNPESKIENKSKVDLGQFSDIYTFLVRFCGPPRGEFLEYLVGPTRRLETHTLAKFRVCAVTDWRATEHELRKEFGLDRLRAAGIFWRNSDQFIYRGKWVLVPFFQNGKIIFLQGRRLDGGKPKYLHLQGLSVPLYNQDTIIDEHSEIYVCEGVFDAMVMEQWHRPAVAVLGVNNFKPEHAESLKSHQVVIAMDNDRAGEEGAGKISEMLQKIQAERVSLFKLPSGIKDLTEFYISELDKSRVKV